MPRTGALVVTAALVAVGVFVALPDDEPRYLGDMPSQIEQAQAESVRAEPEPPSPPAPVAPPVDGPSPVGVDAPAAAPPGVPAERVPAPVTDTALTYPAETAASGDPAAANAALLDFLDGLPLDGLIPCVDTDTIFKPGLGTFDCLTGELLEPIPDPDLPIDPTDPLDDVLP
jgi:hypothetical protein